MKEKIEKITEILELGRTIKSNENLQMLCPFHNDTNPSFGININKGIYNCFSCGVSGQINNISNHIRSNIIAEEIEDILNYKIKTFIDGVGYKEKPKNELANITNRIEFSINHREYSIKDIIALIVNGHTVIPAGVKTNEEWKEQQLVMLDFDNKETNFTREEVLEYSKQINLVPTFSYYTFSNSAEKEKFRICYCFKECIRNKKQMTCIINNLLYKFKKYDPDIQCRQLSSKFLGTNNKNIELSNYIYESNNRFTEEQLDKVELLLKPIEYNNSNKEISSIDAKELLSMELEPLTVIVDNMLYAGFSIMAGAPKVRKKLGFFRFMHFCL